MSEHVAASIDTMHRENLQTLQARVEDLSKQLDQRMNYQDLFEVALLELTSIRDQQRTTSPGALRMQAREAYLRLRGLEADCHAQWHREKKEKALE